MISKSNANYESVFDKEPEEAVKLLNALADIPLDTKLALREPSNTNNETPKEDYETILEEQKLSLITAYMEASNNLDSIRFLQNSIEQTRRNLEMSSLPTENWEPRLVFFLMIREGLQLEDIDQLQNLADIGVSPEDMKHVKRTMETEDFLKEILIYKGLVDDDIDVAVQEAQSQKTLDDALNKMKEDSENELAPIDTMALEAKLVEMDYSEDEMEEIAHGHEDLENESDYNLEDDQEIN